MKPTLNLSKFPFLAAAMLSMGSAYGHTSGATTWTGANSSDWADDDNWTTATAPVTGEAPTGRGIRINVGASGNTTPPELIYAAAQGHTIYNISGNRALVIGNGSGTNGTVTITGGLFDSQGSQNDVIANGGGSGTINISGGHYTNVNAGSNTFALGLNFGGTATLNINEGSFTTGILTVGESGTSSTTGIINLNGGVLEIGDFVKRQSGDSSTINFNGGTLRARGADNASFMGTADVNTARVEADGAVIDTNGFDITIGQALIEGITEGGGLTKQGEGTLTLGGENTYKGETLIYEGTLALTGATQDTASITFAEASDGVLGFDITSPVTASSAAVNLDNGTILVLGTPAAASYTLLTADSITGTPVLSEAVGDYTLQIVDDTELRLVSDSAPTDPYLDWAGEGLPFDGDASGDGISNGLAFLLGAADPQEDALSRLPEPTEENGALVLTFQMRNAGARGTAVLNLQYSSDLGITDSWTTVVVPETTPEPQAADVTFMISANEGGSGLNDVVATIAASEAGSGKLFARLQGDNP